MRKGLLLSAVFSLALLAISGCGGGGRDGSADASGGGGSAPLACPTTNPIIGTDNQLAASAIVGKGALASGAAFAEQIALFVRDEGYDNRLRKTKDNLCTSGSMTHNLNTSNLTLTANFNNCSFSYNNFNYTVNGSMTAVFYVSDGFVCPYVRRLSAPNMKINVTRNNQTTTFDLANFSYSASNVQFEALCWQLNRETITINQGSRVVSTSNNQQVEALALSNVVVNAQRSERFNPYVNTYSGQFYVKTGCVDACVNMQTITPVNGEDHRRSVLFVGCPLPVGVEGEIQFSAGNRTVSVRYAQDGLYINNQRVSNSCVIPACMQ